MAFLDSTWDAILRSVAWVLYSFLLRPYEVLWGWVSPLFAHFVYIYNTIDFDNLDLLYVIKAFIKGWLMVALYVWQWMVWMVNAVLGVVPGGRWLQDHVFKVIDQLDHEHRFLRRPLSMGTSHGVILVKRYPTGQTWPLWGHRTSHGVILVKRNPTNGSQDLTRSDLSEEVPHRSDMATVGQQDFTRSDLSEEGPHCGVTGLDTE
ncbi:hypothetical protein ACOMHN_012680 [Nucella lapillus]